MKTRALTFQMCFLIIVGCRKDEISNPQVNNIAPSAFELINVPNNSMDVIPTPILNWEEVEDSDGDMVRYDLYLGTNPDPVNIAATGLSNNSFTFPPTNALSLARDYYWKVVAKDGKGGETSSAIFTFKVKSLDDAKKLETQTPFPARENHASVVFDERMWVLGGFSNGSPSNNPLESKDGKNWSITIVMFEERFTPRFFHGAVGFEDGIWVAGGVAEGDFASDIWYSDTGAKWAKLDQNIGFPERAEHTITSYDNRMWIIGGSNNSGKLGDVYSSLDGVTWARPVEQAAFGKRNFHRTVAFQDKLWVIGGIDDAGDFKNDVWNSTDGILWNEVTLNAGFSPRGFHKTLVFDNKIWVIGGGSENDIWYTEDGIEWVDATPENSFTVKSGFTALFYENKIWILGGSASNEIWTIDYHDFEN